MAKVVACAFRDIKLGAYMLPFFQPNEKVAMRAAKHALNHEGSELYAIREDIELWQIGEYEDTTGNLIAAEHKCLAAAGVLIDG